MLVVAKYLPAPWSIVAQLAAILLTRECYMVQRSQLSRLPLPADYLVSHWRLSWHCQSVRIEIAIPHSHTLYIPILVMEFF